MKNQLLALGIMLVFLMVGFSGCNEIGTTLNPITNKFIGEWDGGSIKITIYSDGTVNFKSGKKKVNTMGTWELKDDILHFDFKYMSSINWRYKFSNNYETLTLTVTSTGQKIEFTKQ